MKRQVLLIFRDYRNKLVYILFFIDIIDLSSVLGHGGVIQHSTTSDVP